MPTPRNFTSRKNPSERNPASRSVFLSPSHPSIEVGSVAATRMPRSVAKLVMSERVASVITAAPAEREGSFAQCVRRTAIGCAPIASAIRRKSAAGEITKSGRSLATEDSSVAELTERRRTVASGSAASSVRFSGMTVDCAKPGSVISTTASDTLVR